MTAIEELAPRGQVPVERKPGDFLRTNKGIPLVTTPDGGTVKKGPREGERKRTMYGRPSGLGKQIEDTYNLQKWSERRIVLGIGSDPTLGEAVRYLDGIDPATDTWHKDADSIVKRAKLAAKANEAAERGSHTHELTDDINLDDEDHTGWLTKAEAGEDLGLSVGVQAALVAAWRQLLADYGLKILRVETPVVHDGYRQAGTLDRLARLTRDLRFVVEGEVVTLPAGLVIVLDLKTGNLKVGHNGHPSYWHSYAVQVACYAGGVPYDVDAETRGEWPWDISQEWALIGHLPVLDALDGTATATVLLVDLAKGNMAAEMCVKAKEWSRSADVFGWAHRDEPAISVPVIVPSAPPTKAGVADHSSTPASTAPLLPAGTEDLPPSLAPALAPSAESPAGSPTPSAVLRRPIDEGGQVDEPTMGILRVAYANCDPDHRNWIGQLWTDATGNADFHLKGHPTVRRFELVRALVHHTDRDEEYLRHIITHVVGQDYPLSPTIPLGMAVGSMSAGEAKRFAEMVTGPVIGLIATGPGTWRLAFDVREEPS